MANQGGCGVVGADAQAEDKTVRRHVLEYLTKRIVSNGLMDAPGVSTTVVGSRLMSADAMVEIMMTAAR